MTAGAQEILSTEEILGRIHKLQEEIFERQERIATLVDSAGPAELSELMERGEARGKLRHLERLNIDWENMVAHSRELTDDDLDLVAALVRFVGDLLVVQPEGIAERWTGRLEDILES
ncbi:MAG: hypothetical protein V3T72_18605 [Thermoanaerobaculia bacterium]